MAQRKKSERHVDEEYEGNEIKYEKHQEEADKTLIEINNLIDQRLQDPSSRPQYSPKSSVSIKKDKSQAKKRSSKMEVSNEKSPRKKK